MLEWLSKLKEAWFGTSCRIKTPMYDSMVKQLREIHEGIQEVRQGIISDKRLLMKELQKRDVIINNMIEHLPDMLWFKDAQGRYVYANKAIRDKLLFNDNPVGLTDFQLSRAAKIRFGEKEHSFGDICGNSDLDVIANKYIGKTYVESGKIKGKMIHLEVNKSIIEAEGEVLGVVGSGRDITDYREEILKNGQYDVFKKNEFANKDV